MDTFNPISNLLNDLEKDLELISQSQIYLKEENEDSDSIELEIDKQINCIRRNLIKLVN